ncbi:MULTISPECIES: TIR domain-containing anti-phage reverse transcriptase [Pseudoalteromonas]|uniref:TIR domain-containing anti-phage reverse transcriptase n=1 Tax=Pseudoalteromonas TaxID=53246 RepID=UPI0013FD16B2|nr:MULTISPECIES: TIR domain-containing anti-phage reverse transcriptase [Pseudoalteromonas]|tara:strand:- start:2107 stop:3693 length:1587 start_codon:yes stop_codon:yes gene_type:complete
MLNNLLFHLNLFEPKKISNGSGYTWINPKLSPHLTRELNFSQQKFLGLQTDNDVANILELPVGQLLYILYSQNQNYKSFTVKKKSGEDRSIESPCSSVKILQDKVKPLIEAHYRVKKPVHGFVGNGKGIISNAEQHKKKAFVLNIDLKDFFHSVNFGRVQGIFKSVPFNMGVPAATVLAQICTYKGRLPQGASTSPVLSNLASTSLDRKLTKIAKKFHLVYTRYADDITFSSNKPFSQAIIEKSKLDDEQYIYKVGNVLEAAVISSGFSINHKKTRLQHKSQRQEVTGLVVNKGVNINRKFIRKTRAMINEWGKNLIEAEKRFIKVRYHAEKSEIDMSKLDGSIYKRAVYGNLSFIRMVRGEDHSPYLTLCKKVLELDNNPPAFINKLKGIFEMYDVFICHASEDKESVALPLYESLKKRNINAFIDCFAINWGDSLVAKINTALQKSKYVIAIISEDSVKKSWPMKELNAVLSAEIGAENTKLLPLMVGDGDALISQLPLLADKLFVGYKDNIEEITDKIESLLMAK